MRSKFHKISWCFTAIAAVGLASLVVGCGFAEPADQGDDVNARIAAVEGGEGGEQAPPDDGDGCAEQHKKLTVVGTGGAIGSSEEEAKKFACWDAYYDAVAAMKEAMNSDSGVAKCTPADTCEEYGLNSDNAEDPPFDESNCLVIKKGTNSSWADWNKWRAMMKEDDTQHGANMRSEYEEAQKEDKGGKFSNENNRWAEASYSLTDNWTRYCKMVYKETGCMEGDHGCIMGACMSTGSEILCSLEQLLGTCLFEGNQAACNAYSEYHACVVFDDTVACEEWRESPFHATFMGSSDEEPGDEDPLPLPPDEPSPEPVPVS